MILDIIIIGLLALSAFTGYKKGFVKVIIKFVGIILAIVLAYIFHSSVANFMGVKMGLNQSISSAIESSLEKYVESKDDANATTSNINIFEKGLENFDKIVNEKETEAIGSLSDKIALFIVKGISFITIFMIVMLIISILLLIADTVTKLPVLKTLNGGLGLGLNILIMIIKILIVLAIIYVLSPLEFMNKVNTLINNSYITKWLYDNNIIVTIIGGKIFKV